MDIKYLIIDVDGTMTDGGIYYDENGNETKKFNTKDAAGFFAAREAGIKTIVITGRECFATAKRMKELKVDFLFQNIRNKYSFLCEFIKEHKIAKEELGYIGDDLNDLQSMNLAGFVGCPNDASPEIKKRADYISVKTGGNGAVRDVIEYILRKRSEWDDCIINIYGAGT